MQVRHGPDKDKRAPFAGRIPVMRRIKTLASCVTLRRSGLLAFAGLLLCVSQSSAELYTIPLLAPSGASGDPQGVLRILNATAESGAVEIHAIDAQYIVRSTRLKIT